MHTELAWLKAIAPDLMGVVTKRYQVLQFINWMAPVGRRTLAEQMKISERALRTETDFLRSQGLLESSKSGMVLTAKGLETFHGLDHLMNQLLGIKDDENDLLPSFKSIIVWSYLAMPIKVVGCLMSWGRR